MSSQAPPHDLNAEEGLLGAMLLAPSAAVSAMEICKAEDFYSPLNGQIFAAICALVNRGSVVDAVLVASEINDSNVVNKLLEMTMSTPSFAHGRVYAEIVVKHAAARRLLATLSESSDSIFKGSDPYFEAERVEKAVSSIGTFHNNGPESITLGELSMTAEELSPVVIPGMLHQDYRTIIVAEEGAGKSLLLRTIAMSAAQGFHPFSHQRIKPVRALVVDLENPAQAILQTAVPFAQHLFDRNSDGYDDERIRFWRRPGGIDIRSLADRAELQREIAFHKPDLVCIGPIYKMYRRAGGESYEDSADEAMAVLDDLRTKYGFALIMEHHAAKGKQGERRDLSPMGSQRWMAWPEIGISLYKDTQDPTVMHVKRYRGDRLQGVNWPDRLVRDKTWLVDGVWDSGMPRY
jgi:hypothetical protein